MGGVYIMRNYLKSTKLPVILSRVVIFLIVLLLLFLPRIILWYLGLRGFAVIQDLYLHIVIFCYLCILPILLALLCLDRLLWQINKGDVFVEGNITMICVISWCCFVTSLFAAVATFFYPPFIFVAIVMFFGGVILRVVRDVFAKAVFLQGENDFTI